MLHQYGSAPNPLLYVAYFLPTSINTAWLSVATAVQLLIGILGAQRGHAQVRPWGASRAVGERAVRQNECRVAGGSPALPLRMH